MLPKSKFLNDTFILTLGVGIAQIIPLLAYPLLSRLFLPQDFGVLSSLTSITSIITIFATLKYDNAILITPSKKSSASLLMAILIVALLLLMTIEVVFIVCGNYIIDLFNVHDVKGWLWICPISAFCIVIYNCFNEWCVKNEYFKTLACNKVINGASIPISKISFAFSPYGLIIGELIGKLITAFSCIYKALSIDKKYFSIPTKHRLIVLLHRYRDCPKYVLPAELLNKIGYELPVFFTLSYFSAKEVGYYSMAQMVLALPTIVIGRSIRDTFRRKANELYSSNGDCSKFYKRVVGVLSLMSIIGFSILYYIAPSLFSFVLGEEWLTAGHYCQILCPMLAFSFVSEIGSCMYIISEKMNLYLLWSGGYSVLTLLSLLAGSIIYDSMAELLICLMIGRSLVYLLNILTTFNLSKNNKM